MIKINGVMQSDAYFNWSWLGKGFGQLSFHLDRDNSVIECNNERMSRDRIRQLLHAYADYIADRAVLLDNPEDIPPINYTEEVKKYLSED